MWGHNRLASKEPAESSMLWLCVLTFAIQDGAVCWQRKKTPSARGGRLRLGLGDLASRKRYAMYYLKHANRRDCPQLP